MTLRPSPLIGAVVALALALAGCGSSDDATPGASKPSTSTPATTPESAEASETVAAATGVVFKVEGITMHAPTGWTALPGSPMQATAFPTGVTGTSVRLFRFPNSGLLNLDELAVLASKESDWTKRARRLSNVEIDSQPAFHVAGKVMPGVYAESFGMLINDERVTVNFEFHHNEDKTYRDEVIQSVLASAQTGS